MRLIYEIILMIFTFIGGIVFIGVGDGWYDALGVFMLFWSYRICHEGPETIPAAIYDAITNYLNPNNH